MISAKGQATQFTKKERQLISGETRHTNIMLFVSFGVEFVILWTTYKNAIVVKGKVGGFICDNGMFGVSTFSNFRTELLVELVYF